MKIGDRLSFIKYDLMLEVTEVLGNDYRVRCVNNGTSGWRLWEHDLIHFHENMLKHGWVVIPHYKCIEKLLDEYYEI